MGPFLQKLGETCYRHKWSVLAIWLALVALLGVAAANLSKPLTDAISIPGTPAQKAISELGETFPESGKGSGRIVYHVSEGTLAERKDAIEASARALSDTPGVAAVISPFLNTQALSQDGRTAYAQVQLDGDQVTEEQTAAFEEQQRELSSQGMQVELSSGLVGQQVGDILGIGEITGVMLALLVLVMTFGALVAAGMPIINALIAIAVSMAGLFALSHFSELNSTTPVLAVMLGLAVGIDYSLFILSKYRTLLLQGFGNVQAAGKAIGTAGNAVIFAAATVIIALSALSVVQVPFMTAMGLAAAATIAIAALVAITLTPALLGIFGYRAFGRKATAAIRKAQEQGPDHDRPVRARKLWTKWINAIVKHPIAISLPIVAVLVVISLPTFKLDLGLPGDQTASSDTTQRKAYDLLSNAFGPGYNAPLTLLVKNVPQADETQKAAVTQQTIEQYLKSQPMLMQQLTSSGQQASPEQVQASLPAGFQQQITQLSRLAGASIIAQNIATQDTVQSATAVSVTDDERTGIIQVIPTSAPNDTATARLIDDIRENPAKYTGNRDIDVQVTGATALEADVNHKLLTALPQYLLVVVGLSLVLLMIAFRSVLIPLKATLGFLLSVGVMFGTMVAVYQWGWFGLAEGAPIVSFIPIIAIGILFGLAMDYEFFLVSGMRESYERSKRASFAVTDGFKHGAKVVVAAATIMVFVFAGFIGSHNEVIRPIGFGLAIGIFVDAFIVRMTLVPAVMSLLGKSAWWLPKWLDRILPTVSIEGETTKR